MPMRRPAARAAAFLAPLLLATAPLAACTDDEATDGTTTTEVAAAAEETTTTEAEATTTTAPVPEGAIRCDLVLRLQLSPGLGQTPTDQAITGEGALEGCATADGDGPESATLSVEGTAPQLAAVPPPPGESVAATSATIRWSDGSTSDATIEALGASGDSEFPVDLRVAVTSGPFSGSTAQVGASVEDLQGNGVDSPITAETFRGTGLTLGG